MTQQRYQILFKGEVLSGFDPLQARADTARLLKAGPTQLKQLFSGRSVGIRKGLPASEAARYRTTLSRIGLRVYVVAMTAPHTVAVPAASSIAGFRIVYSGEVLPGLSQRVVMARVAQKLQLDEARMLRLFSGKKAILKKGLAADAAARYLAEAAQLGMLASMELESLTPVPPPSFDAHAMLTGARHSAEEKHFMESAVKTQLYSPRAPLYGGHVPQVVVDDTSTVVDIDITRNLLQDPSVEKFETPEEPMPQVKTWQPPVPVTTHLAARTLAETVNAASPRGPEAKTALRSVELHVPDQATPAPTMPAAKLSRHIQVIQRLASIRDRLPKKLARILN